MHPSQELQRGLRRVFELEGSRLVAGRSVVSREQGGHGGSRSRRSASRSLSVARRYDTDSDVESGDENITRVVTDTDEMEGSSHVHRQARVLAYQVLASLAQSMITDVPHLNRRQAAAVMTYYADTDPAVVSVARAFSKRLKTEDVLKFLEVQLVCLKTTGGDKVCEPLAALLELEQQEQQEQQEDQDQDEDDATVAGREKEAHRKNLLLLVKKGCAEVDQMVRRLVQSLGISSDQFLKILKDKNVTRDHYQKREREIFAKRAEAEAAGGDVNDDENENQATKAAKAAAPITGLGKQLSKSAMTSFFEAGMQVCLCLS